MMPCDLCEVFGVDAGDGPSRDAPVALFHPPLGTTYQGGGVTSIPSTFITSVRAKRHEFEFYVGPLEGTDRHSIVSQITRAVCTEALHVANSVIMGEMRGAHDELAAKCGVEGLLRHASCLGQSYPYPQFPLGVAFLLPAYRLAELLADPDARLAVKGGPFAQSMFVNGVEAIAYEDPQEGGARAPTYIMPRRGSLALAMSKVAIHAPEVGERRHVRAHFYVGAHPLAGFMVSVAS